MFAMIAGESLTSCQKTSQPDPVVVSSPVQVKLLNILKQLGLISLNKSAGVSAASIIAKGDVVGFSYHDGSDNKDYDLTLNQDLCTKDKMVYDGAGMVFISGQLGYIRHTITQSADSMLVQKQYTKLDKPISENSGWNDAGTYKYVSTVSGIEEYKIISDGSRLYQGKYVPKDLTTVSRVYVSGQRADLTNISIVQK